MVFSCIYFCFCFYFLEREGDWMTSNLLLLFFTAGPSISHLLIFLNQQFLKALHPSSLSSFPEILLLSDYNLKWHVLSCRKYSQPTNLFSRLCTLRVNFLSPFGSNFSSVIYLPLASLFSLSRHLCSWQRFSVRA